MNILLAAFPKGFMDDLRASVAFLTPKMREFFSENG